MRTYTANLHVHTALSPCGGEEMTPAAILAEAARMGLNLIAVTDHNTAGNVAAALEAARDFPVEVLPGMEVQTCEDVHLVCLFPALPEVLAWQELVYQHLPPLKNDERRFGPQILFNGAGRPVGKEERLLLCGVDLGVNDIVKRVAEYGGLCIPAHVDRPSFSLIGHLGFIPPELGIKAVEISPRITPAAAYRKFPALRGYQLVVASDAHYLADLGSGRTVFQMERASPEEMEWAFSGVNGRTVVV